ncbi:winged helix DNA-binding protein [Curtobacterium sp. PhB130]|uniref:winged helix DNA-binding domain-containing protein n=1 Tax=Curtobacterium sp. PhB130 TaxID=2485178 RepID=UPI000F4CAC2F|nr:winged helix DNA-binding domain-containing protein [Curtobacterium sp. PhB130]ROS72246.1 winged helix DNA-binding protein [Curtobacterium sp. PhB130]
MITPARLRAMRLAAQGVGVSGGSALDVVTHMTALQAQDLGQSLWAIGSRALGLTRADVRAAFDRGEFVRSWPMRGTLHVLRPDDLRMLLSLTASRTFTTLTRRAGQLGIDDALVARARDLTVEALGGGRSLDRDGILGRYRDAGIDPAGGRGYHLLLHLAQEGLVAWGPTGRVGQELVLLDEWAPATEPVPDRDEALRRTLIGYLRGRGPATEVDAANWTKLPLGDLRRARAAAGDAVEDLGDGLLALADRPEPGGVATGQLLPGFDEYLLGYADRSGHLDAVHADRVVPGGNGMFLPMAVHRGQVVGTWKSAERTRDVRTTVTPFVPLAAPAVRALEAAAAHHARFLGLPLVIEVLDAPA